MALTQRLTMRVNQRVAAPTVVAAPLLVARSSATVSVASSASDPVTVVDTEASAASLVMQDQFTLILLELKRITLALSAMNNEDFTQELDVEDVA